MTRIYSIRGTNGSGKTTLVRAFVPTLTGDHRGGPVDLNGYAAPTKKEPDRQKRVEGYGFDYPDLGRVGIIGSYKNPCGGLDTINSFDIQQAAIRWFITHFQPRHVLAEGILASTVFGSWGKFAQACADRGHDYLWCYLDTPLEVCLERIKKRQIAMGRERDIKEELVADKIKAIKATRERALKEGLPVYDLPYERAEQALRDIMLEKGDQYRA